MDIEKDIAQAMAVANGTAETSETFPTARYTRWAHFDRLGTDPADVVPAARANVVSSTTDRRCYQSPVLDLDLRHTYIPSDTPGHAHLYLDNPMHYVKVLVLMAVLRWTGVIERGCWRGQLYRGYSAVRPPWVRKHDA